MLAYHPSDANGDVRVLAYPPSDADGDVRVLAGVQDLYLEVVAGGAERSTGDGQAYVVDLLTTPTVRHTLR